MISADPNCAVCRLEEVARIERNAVAPDEIKDGTLYVGLEHIISDGQFVGVKGVSEGELASNKFRFGPQHILFGKLRPYLRKTARPDFQGICSTDIVPILPGPRLDRHYLFYFLRYPKIVQRVVLLSAGANLPRLSPRDLARLEVPVPPLPEQRRIAGILDRVGYIRRKREESIALADEFLRSAFLEMFGDPVANAMRWKPCKLERLCTRITDGTHLTPKFVTEGVPFLFIRNLVNGRLVLTTDKYISVDTYRELTRKCPIERGDVLYAIVGSYGDAAVVESSEPFCFQRHLAHLKPDLESVTSSFLHALLRCPGVRGQADRRVRGVAQPTLNLGDLKDFDVFAPPLEVQKRFDVVVRKGRALSVDLSAATAMTGRLFDSLVHRAFRGGPTGANEAVSTEGGR